MIIKNTDKLQEFAEEPGSKIKVNRSTEWKTVGTRVRNGELPLLNKQLDRLNYATLGDLVRDLMAEKITHLTDDQQIDIMKTNLQTNGQITGFTARLGLLSGLREQELMYIKEKNVCNQGYGCDCDNLHLVNCKNGLTIIAIGWTRGNKKALATILPTYYWNKLRAIPRFDYSDIAATHKIMKRDVGVNVRELII
jgi:hypothetical protein